MRSIRNLTREYWEQIEYSLEGYAAYCNGLDIESVPKHYNSIQIKAWVDGWNEGKSDEYKNDI